MCLRTFKPLIVNNRITKNHIWSDMYIGSFKTLANGIGIDVI